VPLTGEQFIDQLTAQGLTFDPEVVLKEKVESIAQNENGIFVLHAASGQKHYSKTVVVSVGGGILNPQKLEVEGAEKYEVANLHYTVNQLKRFKNQAVIVSGGANSGIDWANELEPIAKKVYVTYMKD